MARKKAPTQPPDPNKLIRQAAGTYLSGDERFEVRGEGNRWFLVDRQRTDELGQELVRGPLANLAAIREAIPEARREEIRPLPTAPKAKRPGKPARAKPAPAPTWIDRLPAAEAAQVRALIRALEAEGIDKAEQLVRRDREGFEPAVASELLRRRLDGIVDEFPAGGRDGVRALVDRVVALLTDEGSRRREPLPGWTLIEIGPEPEPANRRIRLAD